MNCGNKECKNYDTDEDGNCLVINYSFIDYCKNYKPEQKKTRIMTGKELWDAGAIGYRREKTSKCFLFNSDDFAEFWNKPMGWGIIEDDVAAHWTADRKTWHPFKVEE